MVFLDSASAHQGIRCVISCGIVAPQCGSSVCIGKGAETNCLYLFQLTHTVAHSHMNIANNILLSKQIAHSFYHRCIVICEARAATRTTLCHHTHSTAE